MSIEFKLPELGENVEKGDVVRVLVAAGDTVKVDQPVLELETDKATIEVPSSVAGKVTTVNVKPGDKVKVGQVVLVLEGESTPAPAQTPAAAEPPPPPPSPAESPKPAPKPASVVDISSGRPASTPKPEAAPAGQAAAAAAAAHEFESAPVPAAPSVRRFARELGIDIARVPGTGPGGRIGQDDVKQHVKSVVTVPGAGGAAAHAVPLPDLSKWGEVEVKPMSNIRRKTAEHLSAAWQAPLVAMSPFELAALTWSEVVPAAMPSSSSSLGGISTSPWALRRSVISSRSSRGTSGSKRLK